MVRYGELGGPARRRGDRLSELSVPRDLLRPVVERAVAMVRADVAARPPRPAPPSLAPLLRFRQLPTAAVDTVVVALDNDGELRARVASETDERTTGRVGWLWLTRPDGWDDELREALGELAADDGAPSADDVGSEAQLRRRLAGAERAAARAQERVARLEADNAHLRDEATVLRTEHDAVAATAQELRVAADEASRQRTRAVAELKRIERLLARRDDERRGLQQRIEELEAAASVHRPTEGDVSGPVGVPTAAVAALGAMADRIERALGDATVTLDALRGAVGLPAAAPRSEPPPPAAPTPRRRALRMPRGLTDDAIEAAAWLVTERPVLLVDGYNVSMAAWPDADIAEQRQRLVRLLADLAARSPGLGVEVVFDGDSATGAPAALPARSGVNVRFTAPDVEADDVLLAMIGRYPPDRAVVVASTDRRVRDGARRRGANVVSAHQLLAVARG